VPAGNYIIEAPLAMNELSIGNMAMFYSPTLPPLQASEAAAASAEASMHRVRVPRESVQSKFWARSPVTVSNARETGVVVTLNPALSVSGRLVAEASPNRPEPATQPRFLHVQSAAGNPRLGTTYNRDSARANNGLFAITDLVPGAYLFYPDDTAWMIKSVSANGRDHTHTPLEVESSISGHRRWTFTNDLQRSAARLPALTRRGRSR
jgi:hypothetical protein